MSLLEAPFTPGHKARAFTHEPGIVPGWGELWDPLSTAMGRREGRHGMWLEAGAGEVIWWGQALAWLPQLQGRGVHESP